MTTLPASVREHTVLAAPLGMAPQRAAAGAAGLTAGDILRVLRRRLGLILFIWVFGSGLAAGITYLWATKWPLYTASALINVESANPDKPYGAMWDNPAYVKDQAERAMRDQALIIKSQEVLQRTLTDPKVRETYWWKVEVNGDADPNEAMLELQDELSATPVRDSSMVQVTLSTRKPDDAPLIVNTVLGHYHVRRNEILRGHFQDELTRVRAAVEQAETQLQTKINEIQTYQATEAAIPGIMNQMTVVTENLLRLGGMLTEAKARMELLKSQYETYEKNGLEKVPLTPEIVMAVEADPQISAGMMRRSGLLEQLKTLEGRFAPGHRDVLALKARLEVVEQDLQQTRLQKLDEYKRMRMDQVRIDMLAAIDQVNQLQQEYDEAVSQQTDLDRKRARMENLLKEREMAEEQVEKARKALDDITYVSNRREIVRIRTMQDAVRPLERSVPKWKVTMPAGVMLSLLLGVGLALLIEFMNTRVRTPLDVVRHAAMPVLGIVPMLDDEEVRLDNIELATRLAPRSMVAECFRRTRTNLLFSCPPDRQRTVLITSPQPEEGKTAVAVNLAVASAQSGRKVLLVDCNFRRPALYKAFPQLKQQGLSNLLIGQCELKDLVVSTEVPTLELLAAGPTPPNPAELLGSTYFKAFLSEAAGLYDQVFLDGPPGLLVSDALIAAAAVDGVIVVSHAGSTSRGALKRLRDTLDRVGAHVLGVVLNAAEVQAGGYFKEMYRSYYDYDDQASKVLPGPDDNGKPGVKPIEPTGKDA